GLGPIDEVIGSAIDKRPRLRSDHGGTQVIGPRQIRLATGQRDGLVPQDVLQRAPELPITANNQVAHVPRLHSRKRSIVTSLTVTRPSLIMLPRAVRSGSMRSGTSMMSIRTGRFSLSSSRRVVCKR